MIRNKTLWAVFGNGYGFQGPIKVIWRKEDERWWSDCGEYDIRVKGFRTDGGVFSFSSPNKADVELFAMGFKACANIVRGAVSINGG